jgi:hypothetical protein
MKKLSILLLLSIISSSLSAMGEKEHAEMLNIAHHNTCVTMEAITAQNASLEQIQQIVATCLAQNKKLSASYQETLQTLSQLMKAQNKPAVQAPAGASQAHLDDHQARLDAVPLMRNEARRELAQIRADIAASEERELRNKIKARLDRIENNITKDYPSDCPGDNRQSRCRAHYSELEKMINDPKEGLNAAELARAMRLCVMVGKEQ